MHLASFNFRQPSCDVCCKGTEILRGFQDCIAKGRVLQLISYFSQRLSILAQWKTKHCQLMEGNTIQKVSNSTARKTWYCHSSNMWTDCTLSFCKWFNSSLVVILMQFAMEGISNTWWPCLASELKRSLRRHNFSTVP